MNVALRPLAQGDVDQVRDIEREAFTPSWPASAFKRELEHRQATCLVAWEPGQTPKSETSDLPIVNEDQRSFASRMAGGLRWFASRPKTENNVSGEIVGFVGMWFMGTEAHITAIAVRESRRGQGIGELLLMGSIETAMKRGAEVVSLEARVSNHVAHALYRKYGFVDAGIRKGYYSDNREDAVIMTTEPVNTSAYHAKFARLTDTYRSRRGEITICLA